MSSMSVLLAAAEAPAAEAPAAGGAPVDQVAIATVSASLVTAVLLLVGLSYRRGGQAWLRRFGDLMARYTGLPGWAAIPVQVAGVALFIAVFGMYWDIALHIDVGRDEGPLANPAHYFILFGLYGIFAAGFLSVMMADDRHPSPAAIRVAEGWNAPVGSLLIMGCGAFSLLGFPLDDVWHRLFGQDVTLWGPTHLMLIGGASMTLVGMLVLVVEGQHAAPARARVRRSEAFTARARVIGGMGGLLLGLSTFQAEFDFGVPQFSLLLEPAMLAGAAGIGLVAARSCFGVGGAIGAALMFIVVRGLLAILVGPVLGETTPKFPIYLVEALLVEAVFFLLLARTGRPYLVGAVCGVLIGTAGVVGQYLWADLWMPVPWPAHMLGDAVLVGLVTGVAGGIIGAFVGGALAGDLNAGQLRVSRVLAPAGVLAIMAVFAVFLGTGAQTGVTGDVALRELGPGRGVDRTVEATVRISPASAAEDPYWLSVNAWQGDGYIVDHLRRVAPGVYRSTEPLPVAGNWKTMVRLHKGDSLMALPLYLPEDAAIPAAAVVAEPRFTRAFIEDKVVLQREAKTDVPGYLWTLAGLVVLAITLTILGTLGWGLHRVARLVPPGEGGGGDAPRPDDGGGERGVPRDTADLAPVG